jgi:hypothetical protein
VSAAKPEERRPENQDIPAPASPSPGGVPQPAGEVGGPRGPEPTRFGDWEKNGRCSDF